MARTRLPSIPDSGRRFTGHYGTGPRPTLGRWLSMVLLSWLVVGTAGCGDDETREPTAPLDATSEAVDGSGSVDSISAGDGGSDGTLVDTTDTTQDVLTTNEVTDAATPPHDMAADALMETTGEVGSDTSADTAEEVTEVCPPLECGMVCELGFKVDGNGCAYCACVECEADGDCAGPEGCADPVCQAGTCVCGCSEPVPTTLATYPCPDGTEVPWCACGPLGLDCIPRPELQCPTLCTPGTDEYYSCGDGSSVPWCSCTLDECVPECRYDGTADEGFYDPCTDALLLHADCIATTPTWGDLVTSVVYCAEIGSKSEGWYAPSGGLIAYDTCGPWRECQYDPAAACGPDPCTPGDSAPYTCPGGGEVEACACTETAQWECLAMPWMLCKEPQACAGEGAAYTEGDGTPGCCPGLVATSHAALEVYDDGTFDCFYPDCLCYVCTACGDGVCGPGEDVCTCPDDCPYPTSPQTGDEPGPVGATCAADGDCEEDLTCLLVDPAGPSDTGVCTKVCNPMAMGPLNECGGDNLCLPLPVAAAPGFCLPPCDTDADCQATGASCGGLQDGPGACWLWELCDPLDPLTCPEVGGVTQACTYAEGTTFCGPAGAVEEGGACTKTGECAPGLVCGTPGWCAPLCTDDAQCVEAGYEFCNKTIGSLEYGYCLVYLM